MKKIMFIVPIIVILGISGCGDNKVQNPITTSNDKQLQYSATPALISKVLTDKEIISKFKESGIPIGKIIEYTDETDPNKLLGRPNQYIGKINWADTRIKQPISDVAGGTIETFQNNSDCEKRKKYVEQVSSGNPLILQYMFQNNNMLLRLEKDLTPKQVAEYTAIFNK
jgi:hypothetical protein